MSIRFIVFLVFCFNFILLLVGISSIPPYSGLTTTERSIYINSAVTSLALVLLSFWVWQDGKKIEE